MSINLACLPLVLAIGAFPAIGQEGIGSIPAPTSSVPKQNLTADALTPTQWAYLQRGLGTFTARFNFGGSFSPRTISGSISITRDPDDTSDPHGSQPRLRGAGRVEAHYDNGAMRTSFMLIVESAEIRKDPYGTPRIRLKGNFTKTYSHNRGLMAEEREVTEMIHSEVAWVLTPAPSGKQIISLELEPIGSMPLKVLEFIRE